MPSEVFMVISYYGTGLDASSIAVFCLLVCLVQSVQFPLKKKWQQQQQNWAFHDWCHVAFSISLKENLLNFNMFGHYPSIIPYRSQTLPVCPFNREVFCLSSHRTIFTTSGEYASFDSGYFALFPSPQLVIWFGSHCCAWCLTSVRLLPSNSAWMLPRVSPHTCRKGALLSAKGLKTFACASMLLTELTSGFRRLAGCFCILSLACISLPSAWDGVICKQCTAWYKQLYVYQPQNNRDNP